MNDWIATAIRLAEEVDREIGRHGVDIDIYWVQEKARDIAWHCRGALGDPGPRTPVVGHPAID